MQLDPLELITLSEAGEHSVSISARTCVCGLRVCLAGFTARLQRRYRSIYNHAPMSTNGPLLRYPIITLQRPRAGIAGRGVGGVSMPSAGTQVGRLSATPSVTCPVHRSRDPPARRAGRL